MPLFWKPYTSEVTQFIEELKARKPTLEAEQRAGRALLWDKPQDRAARAQWQAADVPQQPYVYQTESSVPVQTASAVSAANPANAANAANAAPAIAVAKPASP